MTGENEIKTVFIGDIAFNKDITAQKELTSIGGAAYYSAVGGAAANRIEQLVPSTGVVAPVGDDFNLDKLTEKGIDVEGVVVVDGGKTCRFTLIQYPNNTRGFRAERLVAEGVNTTIFPQRYLMAEFIHLATSLPQNYLIWTEFLAGITEAKLSADAFELFASEFPDLTISVLNAVDMIFINEEEANILSRKGTLNTDVPWILKRGPGGVSYLEGSREIAIPAPPVAPVETTGAGDTLAGAFLTLLSNDYEVEHALTIAASIASRSVTQFGVEHLLAENILAKH